MDIPDKEKMANKFISDHFYEVPKQESNDYDKYICLTRQGEESFFEMSNVELHIMADILASSYSNVIFKTLQERRDRGKELQQAN